MVPPQERRRGNPGISSSRSRAASATLPLRRLPFSRELASSKSAPITLTHGSTTDLRFLMESQRFDHPGKRPARYPTSTAIKASPDIAAHDLDGDGIHVLRQPCDLAAHIVWSEHGS